jgi:serine/threonine protein kinase
MNRWLTVIAGPNQGKRFQVTDAITTLVGRSRHVNAQLADTSVSRVHCEVEIRKHHIFLTDLESASGTFVNNERVSECELKDGDVVRVGNTQLRVETLNKSEESLEAVSATPPRPVPATADRLGELTGGRLSHFDVGPVLARGKSGLVFRAYDFKNDRDAAIKVLWPEFAPNEDDMQRYVRAVKTMLPLRQPNLVALYGSGTAGPFCWIAMELVEGKNLVQVLSALERLDWKRTLWIAFYLAKALEYAHGQNVFHRNITPNFVLIGETADQTKLSDFILAKVQDVGLAKILPKPGEVPGDLRYMSPERIADGGDIDARCDLYGLGALMYAMLTGRAPFEGRNATETMSKIRQVEPTRPRKILASIPDSMEKVVLKLLAKKPEDRYPSMTALIKELERVAKLSKTDG